jgi:hypothetical protein
MGLFQFMPGTWKAVTARDLADPIPTDPIAGRKYHVIYMARILNHYTPGDICKALGGYNWGPNRKIFTRTRGRTFWDIDEYLPKETREYVPRILAYIALHTNRENFGLSHEEIFIGPHDLRRQSISIDAPAHPTAIADALNLDPRNLNNLNVRESIDLWIMPGEEIILPIEGVQGFDAYYNRITGEFTERGYIANQLTDAAHPFFDPTAFIPYTVVPNDNYGKIAAKFSKQLGCELTASDLMRFNGASTSVIHPGDELMIPPCGWDD